MNIFQWKVFLTKISFSLSHSFYPSLFLPIFLILSLSLFLNIIFFLNLSLSLFISLVFFSGSAHSVSVIVIEVKSACWVQFPAEFLGFIFAKITLGKVRIHFSSLQPWRRWWKKWTGRLGLWQTVLENVNSVLKTVKMY